MASRRRNGNGSQREAGATGARLDDIYRRVGGIESWQAGHDKWAAEQREAIARDIAGLRAEIDGRMLRLEKRVVWFAGAGAGIGGFIALGLTILGALAAWRH